LNAVDGQTEIVPELPDEITGEVRELLESIGGADALPSVSSLARSMSRNRTGTLQQLRTLLNDYVEHTLSAVELPAVVRAWQHADRGELRELLQLDAELRTDPRMKPFRAASCAVGRRQLSKLRALKDHRLLQRYLHAVESGEAAGWHAIVYGIFLSVYSVPVRQGLLHLARNTIGGLAFNATHGLGLRLSDSQEVLGELTDQLPEMANRALSGHTQMLSVS
tara:strand:+ start:290 stop:955 length:666 start_codon:yes stop_codon:yes gene_type:complete